MYRLISVKRTQPMNIKYSIENESDLRSISRTATRSIETSTYFSDGRKNEVLYIPFDSPVCLNSPFSDDSCSISVKDIECIFLHFSKQFVEKFSLDGVFAAIKKSEYKKEKPVCCEQPVFHEQPKKPIEPKEPLFEELCPSYDLIKSGTELLRLMGLLKKILPSLAVKIIPTHILNQLLYQNELQEQLSHWKLSHEIWQKQHSEWQILYQKWIFKEMAWVKKNKEYQKQKTSYEKYCTEIQEWESRKLIYEKERDEDRVKFLAFKADYLAGRKNGILDFCGNEWSGRN